jgi:mannosyltransferase
MINIGFDGVIFGISRIGGINTYAWEMLWRLSKFSDAVVTLGLPDTMVSGKRDAIEALNLPTKQDIIPAKAARYMNSRLHNDVVHSTYYRQPASKRSKSVVTVYDFVYERYRSGLARKVHSLQKSRACKTADAILCISENTKKDLLKAYPEIDPAIVCVTPLAPAHDTFFVPENRYPDICDAVLYVGGRSTYKRFDLAVQAAALSSLRLVVVGPPIQEGERMLLDRYLAGRWSLLGQIDDATLRQVYAGAYAFVYTSDYEGFGLPILEAQACGCPAVVANRSSFPEVGGTAALYAREQTAEAYAECLLTLADTETRNRVMAAGLANSAQFNWNHTFDLTISVYRELLS